MRKLIEKMKENSPIGMRTVKTALSIFLCLLIYQIAEEYGAAVNSLDAFLACVTAIICMRDSMDESVKMGLHRLLGTFIGAVLGLLCLSINVYIQNPYLTMLVIAFGIVVVITACNLIGYPESIIICCVVFLVIAMEQADGGPLFHAAKRFIDTAVGMIISYLVNRFVLNPDKRRTAEIPVIQSTEAGDNKHERREENVNQSNNL